jgi:hypothetical protein
MGSLPLYDDTDIFELIADLDLDQFSEGLPGSQPFLATELCGGVVLSLSPCRIMYPVQGWNSRNPGTPKPAGHDLQEIHSRSLFGWKVFFRTTATLTGVRKVQR